MSLSAGLLLFGTSQSVKGFGALASRLAALPGWFRSAHPWQLRVRWTGEALDAPKAPGASFRCGSESLQGSVRRSYDRVWMGF